MRKHKMRKRRTNRYVITTIIVSALLVSVATFYLYSFMFQRMAQLTVVDITLSQRIDSYLENKRKLFLGRNYCTSQVLASARDVAYARFACANADDNGKVDQAMGSTAKFSLKNGDVVAMTLPSEAAYNSEMKKLLPPDVYNASSYYASHYGIVDLMAVNEMKMSDQSMRP